MFTGKKNQIVLLIINFFPKIASLPLPNPIYHWNGLPLQKDINLHICAVLSWRNGGPAREKQPRRSRSAALHSDFKHFNLPAGHSSAAAMLPSVFWPCPSTWTYWKQLCWGWDTCDWNVVCSLQWYASELVLALGRSLCSYLVCHLSSPTAHCFLHVSCSVLSILFATLQGFTASIGRCCCCQVLDF